MKRFLAFVKKESLHILRDTRTLILLFVMPLVLVLLFGFAITTEVRDASISILDRSGDRATRTIADKLTSSGYFLLDNRATSLADINRAFRKGDISLAIVFPADFEHDLVKYGRASLQVVADATDPNKANTLRTYVEGIVRSYQQSLPSTGQMPPTITLETRMLYNPRLESAYYFVPGVITIIITLVSAMMTSVTVAREKELGTMEVLLVSPLRPMTIILGKSVPYLVLALLSAISILVLGYFVFEIPMAGSLVLLVAECLLYVLTALALGLLISSRVKTQRVALMISLVGLFLPTMLLSGFIFPIESMPRILQVASNIIPAKWFIIVIKDIMLKGVGLAIVWQETVILLGITLVFLAASILGFKKRLA